jgi:hypothetical protein
LKDYKRAKEEFEVLKEMAEEAKREDFLKEAEFYLNLLVNQ